MISYVLKQFIYVCNTAIYKNNNLLFCIFVWAAKYYIFVTMCIWSPILHLDVFKSKVQDFAIFWRDRPYCIEYSTKNISLSNEEN